MRFIIGFLLFIFSTFHVAFSQVNSKGGDVEPVPQKTAMGDVYALIVGVSQYQFTEMYDPLQFADVDGRVFYNYLVSSNGGKVKASNIDTLFNADATATAVLTKLDDFIDKLKPNDVFYFYFSGHGDAVNAEFPVLLPFDAPPSRGGKEKNHYRTGLTVLQISSIKNIFKDMQLKGAKVIFISDACRTNELAGGEEGKAEVFKSIMDQDAGELRLTSCSANQVSFEGPQWGGGRGLFSYHLVNGLKGLADKNLDNRVTVREINNYVTEMVEAQTYDTLELLPKQIPQMSCAFTNCEHTVLNLVDKAQKQRTINEINSLSVPNNLIAAKGKGVHLASEMRSLGKEQFYTEFYKRVKLEKLYGTESAHETYLAINADSKIPDDLKREFKNVLSNYLLTSVNKVINAYLNASKNHKVYTKEYFMKAHAELKLFSDLSSTYSHNKKIIDANLLFLEGHSFYTSSKTSDLLYGLSCIDSAIVLNPDAAYLYNVKGILHQVLHQYKLAEFAFRKGVELAPHWIYPVTNVGMIYSILGQRDSSFTYFFKALELDTNYSRTYTIIAQEYQNKGNLDSAFYYVNKGILKDPNDAELINLKATLYLQQKEFDTALSYCYQSIACDTMLTNGYKSAIRTHFEKFAEIELTKGVTAQMTADFQDSLEFYMKKLIQTDPLNPGVYLDLGDFLANLGIYDIAKGYYEIALEFDTLNTEAWNGLGFAYQKLGILDTALYVYTYSLMMDNDYAVTYNLLGNLYFQLDEIDLSIENYQKAHTIDPWSEIYTSGLGFLYFKKKDYRNSTNYYLKNLEQANKDEYVYFSLAQCYAQLNEHEKALEMIHIGLIQFPDTFNYQEMKEDESFNLLKKNKEYKRILKRLKQEQKKA